MKNSIFLMFAAFSGYSTAATITIDPVGSTSAVYTGFSLSAPTSQTPTSATWGDAWLIGTPFQKDQSSYPQGWAIVIEPYANVPSHNSGKLGTITVVWSNDDGTPQGNTFVGGSVQTFNLPSSGNRVYWCGTESTATSPVNRNYQWKIRSLQLDNPLSNNVSWKLSYQKCTGNNTGKVVGPYIIGYTNQSNSTSGCDINFTSNFNVIGQVNQPIFITETGLSKSRCTTGNKYSLSFTSSNSNIKIIQPNGTAVQSYTIGDVSTVSNGSFPTYRVEGAAAGTVSGSIQLNLTSK